jgi:hypothetical protein
MSAGNKHFGIRHYRLQRLVSPRSTAHAWLVAKSKCFSVFDTVDNIVLGGQIPSSIDTVSLFGSSTSGP